MVEDLLTSYLQWYDFDRNPRPKYHIYENLDFELLNKEPSAINYFRDLVHRLNYAEIPINNYTPTLFDTQIESLHFYHNLVFIYKNPNLEKGGFDHPQIMSKKK